MDALHKLVHMVLPPETGSNTSALVTTTAIMSISFYTILNHMTQPRRACILPSPLSTLIPALSPEQKSQLLYPPDFFPGARDVATPYGSIRCYEFGPAEGRKVLLIHGISTSCMTLTHVAHGLAARGCRVLLYDLSGRGFSDAVGDLPYDERLLVSQALLALASSELAWTGQGEDEGFHLLGYSLGGAVAAHLAGALPPGVVKSLILFAPAGMIRLENFGLAARLVFRSGWVPGWLVEVLTSWRLQKPIAAAARRKTRADGSSPAAAARVPGDQAVETAVVSEIADSSERGLPNALQRRVLKHVNWQVANHQGFVPAFMSTLRYAPMTGQHDMWRKLAVRKPKTTLFLFGEGDAVVSDEDYREDVLPLVGGEEHVCWPKPVPGAHDFPMTHPEQALERIWKFWGWDEDVGGSWLKAEIDG